MLRSDPSSAPDPASSPADPPAAPADVAILVCVSCRGADSGDARPRAGERLLADTLAQAGVLPVRGVECLGNCKRRLSAALVADNAWTYVFGDLHETSGADLAAGAQLLRAAPDGLLPWRARPNALKRGLVARLPPSPLKDPS